MFLICVLFAKTVTLVSNLICILFAKTVTLVSSFIVKYYSKICRCRGLELHRYFNDNCKLVAIFHVSQFINSTAQRNDQDINTSFTKARKYLVVWSSEKNVFKFFKKEIFAEYLRKKDAPENNKICYGWLSTKWTAWKVVLC